MTGPFLANINAQFSFLLKEAEKYECTILSWIEVGNLLLSFYVVDTVIGKANEEIRNFTEC